MANVLGSFRELPRLLDRDSDFVFGLLGRIQKLHAVADRPDALQACALQGCVRVLARRWGFLVLDRLLVLEIETIVGKIE